MSNQEYKLIKFIDSHENRKIYAYGLKTSEHIVWIPFHELNEFVEIIGHDFLCEGNCECVLMNDDICIDVTEILGYFGIELDVIEWGE